MLVDEKWLCGRFLFGCGVNCSLFYYSYEVHFFVTFGHSEMVLVSFVVQPLRSFVTVNNYFNHGCIGKEVIYLP